MKLGIMSDTHDNIWKLEEAISHLSEAQAVLHCGDICSPFMIRRLGERLAGVPVHVVWGNNDGDPFLISRVAVDFPSIQLHGLTARLEFDGRRVAVNHYPDIARDMAHAGRYDIVCYGHDHTAHEERMGDTLLVNPGEVLGLKGRSSLAVVETEDLSVQFVDL